MRSATTASRNAKNYTHRNNHSCKTHRRNQTTAAAPAAHTRYLSSPPAATLRGKTQGFVLRLPPQNKAHATFMQPFQCDLQPQLQETQRTTHTGTTILAKHIEGTKRPQPHPPHTRGTFHRRLQPLYAEKHKVSCSGFLPNSPLAFVTASLPHHFPPSPLPFIITSLLHHFPSSPLPIVTASLPHHFPSSRYPFIITSLLHHFPSSPLPIVTTSLPHHFPSSPLFIVTTSHRHHVPSSPPRHCQHPSSRSIPPLLILLLRIDMLCIVIRSTALHHFKSQSSICPQHGVLLPNFL